MSFLEKEDNIVNKDIRSLHAEIHQDTNIYIKPL